MSLLPGRLYSNDQSEEDRLLEIRNRPGDRTRLIAKARIRDRYLPLHDEEWHWLLDEMSRDRPIPRLDPLEWHALFAMMRRVIALSPETMAGEREVRRQWEASFEAKEPT